MVLQKDAIIPFIPRSMQETAYQAHGMLLFTREYLTDL